MGSERETKTSLDRALQDLRAECRGGGESLSEGSRAAIFSAARASGRLRPIAALFVPVHRWVLAGAFPVVLVATLAVWNLGVQTPGGPGSGASLVQVSKLESQVVFMISNGDRDHVVTRSARPDRFDPTGAQEVRDSSFADSLDSGSPVVFYRID